MEDLIKRICDFYDSPTNILILHGPDGCGKSSAVARSLELSGERFLAFYHNCFEFCTIDDFLLNFYDSFKKYSTSRNITFKKAISDEFSGKIVNYFRETAYNFVIVVDNFELARAKKEISDFLFSIADFENVKLVLITSEHVDISGKNAVTIEFPASQKDDVKRFLAISDEYQNLLKTFAMLYHTTSAEFLKKYKLASGVQIQYLLKIEALKSGVHDTEVTLRKHLRHYFLNKIGAKEKNALAKKLVDIYENELSKSPKDRLLRLSRESLRNLVTHFSPRTPKAGAGVSNFSYLAQTYTNSINWNKLPEEVEAPPLRFEEREKKELGPEELFEHALACEDVYNYSGAIEALNQARFLNGGVNPSLEVKILSRLTKNYIKTNAHEQAISCEIRLFDILKGESEPRAQHSLYRIGLIYKNLFDWENAVKYFEKVLTKPDAAAPLTLAKTFLHYGEIEENRGRAALEKYKKAFEISQAAGDPKLRAIFCESAYKIGQIYDLHGEITTAREFYEKNISKGENPFLGASYLALADTLTGDEALGYYNAAIKAFNKNGGSLEELYFIYDKLAQNAKYSDPAEHFKYLTDAKKAAQKLKDNFKLAFILCEIGDYYYNKTLNRDAVFSYLEAKKALGHGASESNLKKINSRLEDMKIKMGKEAYDVALREFTR